ncbi:hypothetical protein LCGC14_2369810 [marine sediment metagenome]|uniref:Uncharacterized protein n=1 Tax=marine sediment metagenome TaxID=412755 RepID=A0A0F9C458_9ZZZZ
MKQSVRIDHDPSGMSNAGRERLDKIVVQGGYKTIGVVPYRLGDIYVAERLVNVKEGWEVLWAARDAVQPVTFALTSTAQGRFNAAVMAAKDYLAIFDKVERRVH